MPVILILISFIFNLEAQDSWTPYYIENQQRNCPHGYTFDYTRGLCTYKSIPNNNENCAEDILTGEIRCQENVRANRQKENSDPTPSRCATTHAKAKTKCNISSSQNPQALTLAQTVQSQRNIGNTKQACELAKQLNSTMWSANTHFGIQCNSAIRECSAACSKDSTEYDHCQSLKKVVESAKIQSIESAKAFAVSQECVKVASNCDKNSFDNPNCPQYCKKPGRQNDPLCVNQMAQNNCGNPAFAMTNLQLCNNCITNPKLQGCSAQNPIPNNIATESIKNPSLLKLPFNNSDNDFLGNTPSNKVKESEKGAVIGSSGFNAKTESPFIPPIPEVTPQDIKKQQMELALNEAMGITQGIRTHGSNERFFNSNREGLELFENKEIDIKPFLPSHSYKQKLANSHPDTNLQQGSIDANYQRKYNAGPDDIVFDFSDSKDRAPSNYIFTINRKKAFITILLFILIASFIFYEIKQRE